MIYTMFKIQYGNINIYNFQRKGQKVNKDYIIYVV